MSYDEPWMCPKKWIKHFFLKLKINKKQFQLHQVSNYETVRESIRTNKSKENSNVPWISNFS